MPESEYSSLKKLCCHALIKTGRIKGLNRLLAASPGDVHVLKHDFKLQTVDMVTVIKFYNSFI